MFPNPTIYDYDAVQGMVEERIARTKRRSKIHRLMRETRARRQFRRSIAQGLRNGLAAKDFATELGLALRDETHN